MGSESYLTPTRDNNRITPMALQGHESPHISQKLGNGLGGSQYAHNGAVEGR